ncbi:Global nitrogen regulator [compost metagenome]
MSVNLSRSLIKKLSLFASLSDEELGQALLCTQPCRLGEGDVVFHQGEEAGHFYVLLCGHLKVVQVTPEGERVLVRYVNAGDVFGIAQAMALPAYPASAIAVQDSIVLSWPSSEWQRFAAGNASFASHAMLAIGQRLQAAHRRIQELSTLPVKQRVAHALLRLVSQSGRPTADGVSVDFPISRQDIAEMTGTTLHTVSRLLSAWKDQGVVHLGRKRIEVRALDALVQIANEPL